MPDDVVELHRPAADARSSARRARRRRVIIVLSALIGAFAAWEAITRVVAYTGDAYVRSDLVAASPEATGHIVAVHVQDNQTIRRGEILISIDPVPFQLAVDASQAALKEANAQATTDRAVVAMANDGVADAEARLKYAQETQYRAAVLVKEADVSRQQLDAANEALQRGQAGLAAAQAALRKAQQTLAVDEAAIARAQAELATAEWRLSRTKMYAPVDGAINNLTVRVGDTARENTPLIGIVDAQAWRIIANYKQDYLRFLPIGGTAWIWLDSHPWRFYRARIQGIGRGIDRNPDIANLLPNVAPTTDWIRLQRRFPVTLVLVDPPADLTLFMAPTGAA